MFWVDKLPNIGEIGTSIMAVVLVEYVIMLIHFSYGGLGDRGCRRARGGSELYCQGALVAGYLYTINMTMKF